MKRKTEKSFHRFMAYLNYGLLYAIVLTHFTDIGINLKEKKMSIKNQLQEIQRFKF